MSDLLKLTGGFHKPEAEAAQVCTAAEAGGAVAWRFKDYQPWLDGGFAWGVTLFPRQHPGCEPLYTHPAPSADARLRQTSEVLAPWMAAALGDDSVCAEMKSAIEPWLAEIDAALNAAKGGMP